MNQSAVQDVRGPLFLTFLPALLISVTGLTVASVLYFGSGLELSAAYSRWHHLYYFFLPAALIIGAPFLWVDLRKRGVSLRDELFSKKTLPGDIGVGLLAAIVSLALAIVYVRLLGISLPPLHDLPWAPLRFFVLVLLAPPIKEVAFRLYPKRLLQPALGGFAAFLIGTTAFALADWHNLGASFVAGAIWYGAYLWRPRLIVPITAHAMVNLLTIVLG